jgi:predicted nucleic acid-binding protein
MISMSVKARVFVDTNIVVYALTRGADSRHAKSQEVLRELLSEERSCLSTQVLQETFVTLTKKAGLSVESVLADIDDLAKWPVFPVDVGAIREAGLLMRTTAISFWDSLLVVSARRMGAEALYTEDLNHGQVIGGVRVVNPFRLDS